MTAVDTLRCQIVEAFVIALSVVVIDELGDAGFQVTGQVLVFQQHLVLQRTMPALDLALRHRLIRPPLVWPMPYSSSQSLSSTET